MREGITLFVTRQSTDFRHYVLPNLVVDLAKVGIQANRRPLRTLESSNCVVHEEEYFVTIGGAP
jgi:hypothetical protein